jgi:hypothetical protein
MLDQLTKEDFAERIGQTFSATAGEERTLALTLRRVDALPRPGGDKGREPFSLEFTDEAQDVVPQQTVDFQDPEKGSYPLFVVPLGPSEQGMRYEAIFT